MSPCVIPLLFPLTAVILSLPVGLYLAWILDGRYRARPGCSASSGSSTPGRRTGRQYAICATGVQAMMLRSLSCSCHSQPRPAAQSGRQEGAAPRRRSSTRASSFLTNTNLQHYSGEVHLSYFSQVCSSCWNSSSRRRSGSASLLAIIRGLRGDAHLGNFYLDMWRVVVYVFLPPSPGHRRAAHARAACR